MGGVTIHEVLGRIDMTRDELDRIIERFSGPSGENHTRAASAGG